MNKIRNVEIQVNEAKDIMKGNINDMASGIVKIQELEDYVRELGEDVTEMIQDASPEEKQILAQKLSTLADKVQ